MSIDLETVSTEIGHADSTDVTDWSHTRDVLMSCYLTSEKFTSCASSVRTAVQHLCWGERSNRVCAAFRESVAWQFNLWSSPA